MHIYNCVRLFIHANRRKKCQRMDRREMISVFAASPAFSFGLCLQWFCFCVCNGSWWCFDFLWGSSVINLFSLAASVLADWLCAVTGFWWLTYLVFPSALRDDFRKLWLVFGSCFEGISSFFNYRGCLEGFSSVSDGILYC